MAFFVKAFINLFSGSSNEVKSSKEEEKPLLAEIEEYTGEEIEHQIIDKDDYRNILRDTDDGSYDWKKLIRDANKEDGTEDEW